MARHAGSQDTHVERLFQFLMPRNLEGEQRAPSRKGWLPDLLDGNVDGLPHNCRYGTLSRYGYAVRMNPESGSHAKRYRRFFQPTLARDNGH